MFFAEIGLLRAKIDGAPSNYMGLDREQKAGLGKMLEANSSLRGLLEMVKA